jgi:hypothetical protein
VEGSGRGLIYSTNPAVGLGGLRKTTKNLGQDSWSPGRDLNPGPPEYETGVLTTRSRRWVCSREVYDIDKNYYYVRQ